MMKYGKYVILTAVIILSALLGLPSGAASQTVFTVETNRYALPGEEFTVDVTMSGNSGFIGLRLAMSYNKNLTLVKVEPAKVLSDLGEKANVVFTGDTSNSKYYIEVANAEGNITDNGALFTATFRFKEGSGLGSFPVSVSCAAGDMFYLNETSGELVDSDVKTVSGGLIYNCRHQYISEVTPATCQPGAIYRTCTECQLREVIAELPATDEHKWVKVKGEGKEPTCSESGYYVYECSVCHSRESVPADKLEHSYGEGKVKAPTCTEKGYTIYKCTACGAELKDSFTEPMGHSFVSSVVKEPTCSSVGYSKNICERCGQTEFIEIPKVSHRYVKNDAASTVATHTEKGRTVYNCEFCGETLYSDYTDIIPYDMEYTVVTEPTCIKDGLRHGVCRDGCGHTADEVIPALGHSFGDYTVDSEPTAESEGKRHRVCSVCGETESEVIPIPVESGVMSELMSWFTPLRTMIIVMTALMVTVIIIFVVFMSKQMVRRDRYS